MKQIFVLFSFLIFRNFQGISSHKDHETQDIEHFPQNLIEKFVQNSSVANQNQIHQILSSLGLQSSSTNNATTHIHRNFDTLENFNVILNRENISDLCAVLDQIISSNVHDSTNHPNVDKSEESRSLVWIYGTISITGISLCGLAGVLVIPIVEKSFYFYVLQFFTALAIGTLTGDSLMHLLPHAIQPTSDNFDNAQLHTLVMQRGIATMLGIVTFWFIEKMLNFVTQRKVKSSSSNDSQEIRRLGNGDKHGHSHGHYDAKSESLSSIVWMVVLGDGLHNFTDGMTIGAAFSQNIAGGFSTTVAVFCHELPHELGDFAVLLKAGMSARQAIFYNILSSVLSYCGMCLGIVFGDTPETSKWVFAIAAGLFIYIALVDMVSINGNESSISRIMVILTFCYFQIPELSTTSNDEGITFSQIAIQFAGMISGFGCMFVIALYEHELEELFI